MLTDADYGPNSTSWKCGIEGSFFDRKDKMRGGRSQYLVNKPLLALGGGHKGTIVVVGNKAVFPFLAKRQLLLLLTTTLAKTLLFQL